MSAKTSNRLSIGAVLLAIAVPVGQRAMDTGQKVLEARLVTMKEDVKDESEFKDAVISDLIERVSELEKRNRSQQ